MLTHKILFPLDSVSFETPTSDVFAISARPGPFQIPALDTREEHLEHLHIH